MASNKYKLKIVVPDRLFFEAEVDSVIFKSSEGELGVYAGHVPLTTSIVPGMLRIKMDSESLVAVIHEGFAEILPEQVTMIADAAEWPDELDVERAKQAAERAEQKLEQENNKDIVKAKASLMRALARLEVADSVKYNGK